MDSIEVLKENIWIKTRLLVEGCRVSQDIVFPENTSFKKVHLYAHSNEKSSIQIPDDILIGDLPSSQIIGRVRYKTTSPLEIIQNGQQYELYDKNSKLCSINLVSSPNFSHYKAGKHSIGKVCSYLGKDLLGVIPSNYCFYFSQGKQCRFCEILPTHKSQVEYKSTFKPVDVIHSSVIEAINIDPILKHLALTTGNINSYDWTAEYFVEIGKSLQKEVAFSQMQQVLATLMPPTDFSLIDKIKEAGFNKIYFPLEVHNYEHFKTVCPGKADFGYEKILDALSYAVNIFGIGNVYTNFVFGIQSLNKDLDPTSYNSVKEVELSLEAVKGFLERKVIPAFTIYHFGGYNSIGKIPLDAESTYDFFVQWGDLVHKSGLIPYHQDAVLFSPHTLSNTLFNEGYLLAKRGAECLRPKSILN